MRDYTEKEKASRYDALQAAFAITRENYKRRRWDIESRSAGVMAADIIGAYNKGLADAYLVMLEDLERWMD